VSVLALVVHAALETQAVFGVADPSQRFAPVATPSGWADPCRARWPARGWIPMSAEGAPKSIHNESWLDSVAGWTGTRVVVARRRDRVWHASAFDPCENRWSTIADAPQLAFAEPWPSDGHDRPFQPSHQSSTSNDGFDRISVWDGSAKAWSAIKTAAPLGPRSHYAVALAGQRLMVWGGWSYPVGVLGDGAVLNLARKTWKKMSATGAPSPRLEPNAVVWTGSRLLVWGGRQATIAPSSVRLLDDGAAYDPAADRWTPMSSVNAPSPRTDATVAWTGRKLVVVGGSAQVGGPPLRDGAIYDPAADRWTPLVPPPHDIKLPRGNVGPLTRILVTADGRVVFLPDNLGEIAILDAERARWSTVDARGPGKRNSYRAFLLGQRLIIWGGLTVIAEHICPPPIPGQPICDSFAETASHDDGWMLALPE
jgi:hypothetical protein